MTIKEKLLRLKAINIEKLFDGIIRSNKKEILDMNRDQMYDEGVIDVRQPTKREHYSPSTIKAKKRSAYPKTEFITLKDTGKFHDGLNLEIRERDILIQSDYPVWRKYIERNERFGKALGLTPDNIDKLRKIVKSEMINKLKDVL